MAKIRNGFVSNSSSSSFCIYGTEAGERDLGKLRNLITREQAEAFFNSGHASECEQRIEDYDCDLYYSTIAQIYCHSRNLEMLVDVECEYAYIGLSVLKMNEDETRTQFEDRVKTVIPDLQFLDECKWHIGTINH